MANERISVIHNRSPVILIAPHGYDDSYTDIMTEAAATECNGSAVINHAWERSNQVDVVQSHANCNNIKHATHAVVKDEFLDPINDIISRLRTRHHEIYAFHIHGCGNDIRKKVGNDKLCVVIGYGKGEPGKSRPTCNTKTVDLFSCLVEDSKIWLPGQAVAGSKFAGWDANNLLQIWRNQPWGVKAMQLEFVTSTRKSPTDARKNGKILGTLITKFLHCTKNQIAARPGYSCLEINI